MIKITDMWFHFAMLLRDVAKDSNANNVELGTRGVVSTWAFLVRIS